MKANDKVVHAQLIIEVMVECPKCNHQIDLANEGNYNDEGRVLRQACPDGHWSDKHKDFSVENIECIECGTIFDCKKLEW